MVDMGKDSDSTSFEIIIMQQFCKTQLWVPSIGEYPISHKGARRSPRFLELAEVDSSLAMVSSLY